MEDAELGIEQLVKALPLNERVPVLALKTHYDQRALLD